MLTSRLAQLYFFMPFKDIHGRYRDIPKKVWIFFTVLELIGLGMTAGFQKYAGITAATSLVEVSVLA